MVVMSDVGLIDVCVTVGCLVLADGFLVGYLLVIGGDGAGALVKTFLLGADFGLVVGEGVGGSLLIVLGLGNFCCFLLLMVVLLMRRLMIISIK